MFHIFFWVLDIFLCILDFFNWFINVTNIHFNIFLEFFGKENYICMYVYMYINIYTYTYIYTCMYIYILGPIATVAAPGGAISSTYWSVCSSARPCHSATIIRPSMGDPSTAHMIHCSIRHTLNSARWQNSSSTKIGLYIW